MRQAQSARADAVSRPQLIQSMIDAMRVPDLRGKILFTLGMLVIFRFVAHVPVPGVDTQNLLNAFREQALLGFLDVFSGGALASMSVAALGVYPYITASIVMQILTPVLPNLKALAQEGEYGRQRMNQPHPLPDGAHRLSPVVGYADTATAVGGIADGRLWAEPAHAGNASVDGGGHDVPGLAWRAHHRTGPW